MDHSEVILSDRASTVASYVKGADHPTLFAKGTTENDSTQGGVFFGAETDPRGDTASTSAGGDEEQYFCQPPAGWAAEKVDGAVAAEDSTASHSEEAAAQPHSFHRVFNDDSAVEFDAREEFAGRREGFIFRLGSKGLGYYADSGGAVVPLVL